MLDHTQKTIVLLERCGIIARDDASCRQSTDSAQSIAHVHAVIGSPVNQLQQLHAEFDIPKAAWSQFDLSINLIRGNVV